MKTYRIPLETEPHALIGKARKIATEHGFSFNGDHSNGSFNVAGVSGIYTIEEAAVVVNITSKPFLIPWTIVESKVMEFFS